MLRWAEVVDFHNANAGSVVRSREQGRVRAGRKRGGQARLQRVCGRQTRGGQFRGLGGIILPVVIPQHERSVVVAQLQRRICQRTRHTKDGQAGADTADDDPVVAALVAQDETRDDDVVAGADEGARADVGQLRGNGQTEIVHFNQGDAGSVIVAPDDGGVGAGT